MTAIDKGSGSAYADLGYADADSMRLKADLALAIGDLIAARRLTQSEAAVLLGMTQPKVSAMLRGQFRGISEAKMMTALARLGRDIHIMVVPVLEPRAGRIDVCLT